MELQALRYAGMVARMTFDQGVEAYREFLAKDQNPGDPRQMLLDFLEWPEPDPERFALDVRIVLVAPGFSPEITSTVLWLNEYDLDIRCVRLTPYLLEEKILLNVEQIVPLPEARDYQVQIRQKKQQERAASRQPRAEPTIVTLVASGVLRSGVRLQLIRPPRTGLVLPSDDCKRATFEGPGRQGIRWDFDGQGYSLSGLCKKLCETAGYTAAGAFRGPDYWGLEGETRSLTELAGDENRSIDCAGAVKRSSAQPVEFVAIARPGLCDNHSRTWEMILCPPL